MKINKITLNIVWTMNIALATYLVILDFVSIYYWLGVTVFSVAVQFDNFGWQRGFKANKNIHDKMFRTFERVMKRKDSGEIRISNQDDFRKAFSQELGMDKYYKDLDVNNKNGKGKDTRR